MFKFIKNDEKINLKELEYFNRVFDNSLKIGTEIECMFRTGEDSSNIKYALREAYKISDRREVYSLNQCGVSEVKTDGSLTNGVEILTAGRLNVGYLPLYSQYKHIISKIETYQPFFTQRAGWHNHIMLDYNEYYNSLEYGMKQIVLKNFIMLMKKYMPMLNFITSSVNEIGSLTRRSYFCKYDDLYKINDESINIEDLIESADSDRYQALNLDRLKLENNLIKRLHFELRFPDCQLNPAIMASINYLFRALLYCALDLSVVGQISSANNEEEAQKINKLLLFKNYELVTNIGTLYQSQIIKDVILSEDNTWNDYNSNRLSVPIKEEYIEMLKEETLKMIEDLKNYINEVDESGISYEILKNIAVEPVSIKQKNGKERSDIDIEVDSIVDSKIIKPKYEEELIKMILNKETKGKTLIESLRHIETSIACKGGTDEIKNMINSISRHRNISFTEEDGFYFS